MTRQEHVQWAKERAEEYLAQGYINNAFASMVADLKKETATQDHPGITLGMQMIIGGHLSSVDAMRKFINGFN